MTTISQLSVENFLSLQKVDIAFSNLNVLVGPNGAGKTNVLKVFQFLGDVARRDLVLAIDEFGGFENLQYRGADRKADAIRLNLTGEITQHASVSAPDEYKLTLWERVILPTERHPHGRRLIQRNEVIVVKRTAGRGRRITLSGNTVKVEPIEPNSRKRRPSSISVQGASTGLATLRKLGEDYEASQVEALAQVFEQLRLFEIDVERIRLPVPRTRNPETLRADGSNLAAFLYWMSIEHPSAFELVCDDVRFVLPGFKDFAFTPLGGADEAVRLDILESGLSGSTPLGRASFGTIRSIALFAMLHDPNPPKLTCLEEIDHGLHPHALDRLVDRLREASVNTQIILATHSPALVNRLSASELIVVERVHTTGSSRVFKPDIAKVTSLQNDTGYGLGELWFSGALGGSL
ncbi:AAA family ATPase [Methylobacterium sp. J-070]|uniref:AAA family ATPase n=1 Tax=Methylobacterium sp. J-070 TaxID=2836650 RepID=UPI001FB88E8A|nr:AAA family ATPase [Methylobacterium sp. J-070]MCJ2051214.1 AAA family ATPase [Methylobacterium sp. J-070]